MAINLVRKPSETPNINNYDDYRMFRYATGGYNGVIEKYGNECDYEINGNTFKIKSGEIIIDGIQSKIDSVGVELTVDNVSGTEYYTVYCEVNLSLIDNQKTEIKATKSSVNYPVIEKGDDLTENQTGIARLELYRFQVNNGVISNVIKRFNLITLGQAKNAENATNAENAENATNATNAENATNATNAANATNSTKVGNNTITNSSGLRVTRSGQSTNEVIETKRLLWSGSQTLYNTASKGTTISLSESVSTGDIVEVIYACKDSDTKVERVRVLSNPPGLIGSGAGFNLAAITSGYDTGQGFTATSDTFTVSGTTLTYRGGFYLLNFAVNGGTRLTNNSIILYRIYKIVGGTN